MSAETVARFAVPEDHPALPGHFPGRPIVPGVLLLDQVIEAARAAFALGPASGFPRAKFLAPVLPAEEVQATIVLSRAGRIAFTCRVGDRIVATGDVEFAA
jgi:3-hydroxymyristoyl/3-hydroxydecanoyl-(acyl carrier protein) dehydratase